MKKNKLPLIQILTFSLILISFIACDKDFADLESDIVNSDNATNFDIVIDSFDVITYNKALGPVQTNEIVLSNLGIYDDMYGRTTASFVTQLTTNNFAPDFGNNTVLDSVVLDIPFFSRVVELDDDGNFVYELDSVIGTSNIKLSIFESNYLLRDFDPNGEFNDTQAYYSDQSSSPTEPISDAVLEALQLNYSNSDGSANPNNSIEITNDAIILTNGETGDLKEVTQRQTPGIRLLLDRAFWQEKIIDQEGESVLNSANNFNDYFRGLYFKAEPIENDGSFLFLNLAAQTANITLYYSQDNASTDPDAEPTTQSTFILRYGLTKANFLDNDFNIGLTDGDDLEGDSRLYLKGGEGSIANIKLFNGDDTDEDDTTLNSFETWKNEFVETDENGNFVRAKRLINEAHLIFYVDQDMVMEGTEPNRIYLYDVDNKNPLLDYFLDGVNNSLPSLSRTNHLGELQRVNDEYDGKGIKYKLKITEHINNLLLRDSTNVSLGLATSLNVNLEEFVAQRQVQSVTNPDLTVPTSSVVTPRGTVLHGNNTEDESKRVYLEIYYTEPNN